VHTLAIAPHHRLYVRDGELVLEADDESSLLLRALQRHARLEAEGDGWVVRLGGRVRARLGADGAEADPLTAFEARYLADNGVPLESPAFASRFSPRSDLHTHFAACLSGDDLVAIGAEHGLTLDPALLAEAGVHVDRETAVAVLDARARRRLALALDLPIDQQSFFLEMERRYDLRRPFTRAADLFRPTLERIAERFAEAGVSYAELSLSDCLEPHRLDVLHAALDPIERATGVRLRFLVALRRDDDLEWDLDVLARLEDCLASRAIVGVDVMGHETCSTRAFLPVLLRAAELARLRPGLVIRVHAGENLAYPENVREVFTTLRDHEDVEVRIGHGIYGVDDALLEDLARHADRVVVEFNLSSNLALNNIQGAAQVPLRRYVEAGVACLLGTDGAGLYSTRAADEVRAAIACGLTASHLDRLAAVEARLLARKAERERALPELSAANVPPPRAPEHYGEAVRARVEEGRRAARRALDARLAALGAREVEGARPDLHARPALWLSGAWQNAIRALDAAQLERARALFDALMPALAARGAVMLTGGTRHGVEGLAHEAAARHGVDVLGVLVDDLDPPSIDERVRWVWRAAPTLWKKAEPLVRFVRDVDGLALFVGGGLIVADEHQAAVNLDVRHVVARGFPGVAAEAARLAASTRFVDDAAGVVTALDDRAPRGALLHEGPNDAVDLVVLRRSPRSDAREVLLVLRHDQADAAAGRWSLPGGFVRAGEPVRDAARRVLAREAGLVIDADALRELFVAEGPGRDPRDTSERWVRTTVLAAGAVVDGPITAGPGAARARFVPLEGRPALAFDHDALLARALRIGTSGG
jgi:ADP-ribose pyrophosphatase YjhB (NUDIX family)